MRSIGFAFLSVLVPVSDSALIAGRILIYLTSAAVCFWLLYSLWSVIRKPLSKRLKVKSRRVEIVHVKFADIDADQTVAVRSLDGRKRLRQLFMDGNGLNIGDIGTLYYQGCFGLVFEKEGSTVVDQQNPYYHFGFEQKKAKEAQQAAKMQKNRKKRRYW